MGAFCEGREVGSFEEMRFHIGGIPHWAPGSVEDESAGKKCDLVTWFEGYGGRCREETCDISASTAITNISTDATEELVNQTLVSAPCSFCNTTG